MTRAFACALVLIAACKTGDDPTVGDEHIDAPPAPVTGTISANTTWSGTMKFTGVTVIAPMVTVTVEPNTTLEFAEGAGIRVEGALLANGVSGGKIFGKAEAGAVNWGPIDVSGGFVRMTYVDFTGGALYTNGPFAKLEVVDSRFVGGGGDYVVMNGGELNMQYSQLGPDEGEPNATHCQIHTNSSTSISVIRSNIAGAPFGLMFYGGVGSNFQLNNWYGNTTKDIDTKSGVEGNFSYSWFEKGPPTAGPGATLTLENLATERITQAGPRP